MQKEHTPDINAEETEEEQNAEDKEEESTSSVMKNKKR